MFRDFMMQLEINNIGIVKNANIQLNGLTVICGENDTGKSTIGKTLFALVKGIIGYEEEFQEELSYEIVTRVRRIHNLITYYIDIAQLDDEEIRSFVKIDTIFSKKIQLDKLQQNLVLLRQFTQTLLLQSILSQDAYQDIQLHIDDIENFLHYTMDLNIKQKLALEQAFFSELQSLISQHSTLQLTQNNQVLNIEFDTNTKIKNQLTDLSNFNFDEITYLETPAIIQFFKLIMSAGVKLTEHNRAKETVPLHTKDLSRKLFNSSNILPNKNFTLLQEMIADTIQGDFAYDNHQKDFFLVRNGITIPSMDIASGIKSLGIIDILIKNNMLNFNDILILDEPEVNLHPEWQKKYAEMICLLVSYGVKVLVVTHSPYIVSALHHFSKNTLINRNFYWAEKRADGCYFFDKTDDIMGGIVKKFALALEGMY